MKVGQRAEQSDFEPWTNARISAYRMKKRLTMGGLLKNRSAHRRAYTEVSQACSTSPTRCSYVRRYDEVRRVSPHATQRLLGVADSGRSEAVLNKAGLHLLTKVKSAYRPASAERRFFFFGQLRSYRMSSNGILPLVVIKRGPYRDKADWC